MENKRLGQRVKDLRMQRGLSQEALADVTSLNLRTVQRIESGSTIPRGDTLKRLSEALQVSPDELIDWSKLVDTGYLSLMNISALACIINPLLGIIIPLALWVSKRDKIEKVDEYGKIIINFQISLLIFLSLMIIAIGLIMLVITKTVTSNFIWWIGPITIFYVPVGLYFIYNITKVVINIFRIQNDKPLDFNFKLNIIK